MRISPLFCFVTLLQKTYADILNEYATVRELLKRPWWEEPNEDNARRDFMNMEIDAATVTETIVALADMHSKRHHRLIALIVGLVAACVGFSLQIVHLNGTVRCNNTHLI